MKRTGYSVNRRSRPCTQGLISAPPPLGKVESRDEEGGVGSGDTILGTKLYSCYIKDAIYSILPIYKTVYIMFQDVLNFIFHFLLKKHCIMLRTLNNI